MIKRFSPKEYLEAFNSSPGVIQDLLTSEGTWNLLDNIARRYKIYDDEAFIISQAIAQFLVKLLSNQEVVDVIANAVSPEYFNRYRQELEDKLWSPYETFLTGANIAYKQLTKLEPQPMLKKEMTPENGIKKEQKNLLNETAVTPLKQVAPPVPVRVVNSETQPPPQPVPQKPPELIVIGESDSQKSQPITESKPSPLPPRPSFVPTQTPRIKMGDSKISQQAPNVNIPKPPQPVFMGMQFEFIQKKPELKQEIQGTSEKKDIQVPPAPVVPTTTMQGKQIIDLTDFSVNNPPENKP